MSREAIEKAIRGGALNAVKELDRNGWIGNEDHTARVCAVLEPVFAVFRDAVLEEAAKALCVGCQKGYALDEKGVHGVSVPGISEHYPYSHCRALAVRALKSQEPANRAGDSRPVSEEA